MALQPGQASEVARTFSSADIDEYVDLTGHTPTDGEVPEPLIGALFSYLLGVKVPGMGTMYLKQHSDFKAAARIGDELVARVEITGVRPEKHLVDLRTTCRDADGKLICDGRALVYVKDVRP